ncbi:hypothetical protein AAC387_Pa03g3401 [Persea americana]
MENSVGAVLESRAVENDDQKLGFGDRDARDIRRLKDSEAEGVLEVAVVGGDEKVEKSREIDGIGNSHDGVEIERSEEAMDHSLGNGDIVLDPLVERGDPEGEGVVVLTASTAAVENASAMGAFAGNFNQEVDITWGDGRGIILNNGELLTLSLDKTSREGRGAVHTALPWDSGESKDQEEIFQELGASRALDMLNFTPLNNKPIRIMYSHHDPSIRKSGAANIFIKNLDKAIDNKALHDTFSTFELFSEFGTITSCKVMRDPNGISRGSGFVAFSTPEEASRALAEMNGKIVVSKPLYVALAQRKEDRKARLQVFSWAIGDDDSQVGEMGVAGCGKMT